MARKKKETVDVMDDEVFDMTRAGQARDGDKHYKMYYTKVMGGLKNLKGDVEEMPPDEFLGDDDWSDHDCGLELRLVEAKKKLAIPVWDKVTGKKVGIETALACKELGIKKIPVLICGGKSKKEK